MGGSDSAPARTPTARRRSLLRGLALGGWVAALGAFWWTARAADVGPLGHLLNLVETAASGPWAAAGVFALYLLRPLLLVPITVVNMASGFALGPWQGLALAVVGTLASASVGYAIGRGLAGAPGEAAAWDGRIPRALRRRGFESVVAGGLMYLHADAVNLPAGAARIRFPVFLAGILVGNALTMTSAVLAGGAVEGSLREGGVDVDPRVLGTALALFVSSLALAAWLRRGRVCGFRERPSAD